MRYFLLSALGMSLLAGCGSRTAETENAGTNVTEAAPQVWAGEGFAEARAIYARACAHCHDPGTSDAPRIGVQEDWDERSRNWVAVLTEHAKQGYLAMPAKGGSSDLTDKQVGAAAEYMMAVTYPKLPLD